MSRLAFLFFLKYPVSLPMIRMEFFREILQHVWQDYGAPEIRPALILDERENERKPDTR